MITVVVMLGCMVYFSHVAREKERLYQEQAEQMQEDITLSYQMEKRKEPETERQTPEVTEEKRFPIIWKRWRLRIFLIIQQ